MIEGYNQKEKYALEKANTIAHIQGRYFAEAIMSTIGNAFAKKGQKPHEYPEKPYEFESKNKELTEEEIAKMREEFVLSLQTLKANFDNEKNRNNDNSGCQNL